MSPFSIYGKYEVRFVNIPYFADSFFKFRRSKVIFVDYRYIEMRRLIYHK